MYIGCTNDLKKRVQMHNDGNVASTSNRRPLRVIFYEVFNSRDDAFSREKWLKTGWGRNHLQKMLYNTLESLGG